MKLNLQTTAIALTTILTAVTAINVSVRADSIDINNKIPQRLTLLGCKTTQVKEFTQSPEITNTTNQTLPIGKVIRVSSNLNGKTAGNQNVTLTAALPPSKTLITGIKLQGDNSYKYTCEATF